VSGHAIVGLIALNLWFLAVGAAVLFAARGWSAWSELIRLSGVAYLLGVASLGIAWISELTVGLPMGFAMLIVTGVVVAAIAGAVGYRFGRRLPSPARPRWPSPRISIVSAVFGALAIVYFEALFRAGRPAGLDEFDAWDFWVPKAKAIYDFGGFDSQFFRELGGGSYPPLVPTIDAAAFHFMGSPDVVTLHLQLWFLMVGFATAVLGLVSGRARAYFVWPPLLLLLVTPHVIGHALQPLADFALDELFVVGTLWLALWVLERRTWHLAAATVFLAGAMLAKREGYLYAASAIAAALVVTWPSRRSDWPRLVAVGLLAAAATLPWRILLAVRDLPGGGPEAGGSGLFSHVDRAWPSLHLALSSMFDFETWLVAVPLTLVAVALAFAGGARRLPAYVALLYLFAIAGFTWASWAFPSVPLTTNPALNPIVRLTGEAALLTPAFVPLLLAATMPSWRTDSR
jgi:hypothetical protein